MSTSLLASSLRPLAVAVGRRHLVQDCACRAAHQQLGVRGNSVLGGSKSSLLPGSFVHSVSFIRANGTPGAGSARDVTAEAAAQGVPADVATRTPSVYTNYCVYKGSGSVNFKVIRPAWQHVRDSNYITLSRQGTLFLEFAKSMDAKSSDKKYDWDNKQTFALSATELGQLLDWDQRGRSEKGLSLFHDPGKQKSNEGLITKSLRITPAANGSVFFAMQVREHGKADNFNVPLGEGEFKVVMVLAEYLIPRLLGVDECFQYQPEYASIGNDSSQNGMGGPPPPPPPQSSMSPF